MPSPGELPDPGIELGSPALQMDSLPAEVPWKPNFPWAIITSIHNYLYGFLGVCLFGVVGS